LGVVQPDSPPIEPLPDVGSADARSAQIGGPDPIAHPFKVIAYSGEPAAAIVRRNLLAKDDWRAAVLNEAAHFWPEVSLVGSPCSFAGAGEGLAWRGSGPNRSICWPSGQLESERPSTDAGEEVGLR